MIFSQNDLIFLNFGIENAEKYQNEQNIVYSYLLYYSTLMYWHRLLSFVTTQILCMFRHKKWDIHV